MAKRTGHNGVARADGKLKWGNTWRLPADYARAVAKRDGDTRRNTDRVWGPNSEGKKTYLGMLDSEGKLKPRKGTTESTWEPATGEQLDELRERAKNAETRIAKTKSKEVVVVQIERNRHIHTYVLARAKGVCELCGKPAEHFKANGEPILDTHHVLEVSKDGADALYAVVAVHPNCHAACHRAGNRKSLLTQLIEFLSKTEKVAPAFIMGASAGA